MQTTKNLGHLSLWYGPNAQWTDDLVTELTKTLNKQAKFANTDGLTGISNRKLFHEVHEEEFDQLPRSNAPLSMLLVDVDNFKAFNDTYGHVAGDEFLKRITKFVEIDSTGVLT